MADPRILVAGETLVDFLPEEGSLSGSETFTRRAGGAPANVAAALARLGEAPWFWTRIGTDPFGDFLARALAERGVPDRFVERDAARTALAFVGDENGGEPRFSFYRDGTADTRLRRGRVPDETLAAVAWVAVGGVALASEPARTAVLDLAERAQREGCTVAFDPNARPELWADGEFARLVDEALALADVVKATPGDLHAAGFEGSGGALAADVLDRGPHTLFLTLGEAGAEAHATADAPWGSGVASHDGYAVESVDATGAGDAFTAGVLAGLARGRRDLPDLLGFANAVAAIATTAPGGMAALPDGEAVAAFLDSR